MADVLLYIVLALGAIIFLLIILKAKSDTDKMGIKKKGGKK